MATYATLTNLKGFYMDTKYLSDGRKVVVIGQLNNVETIVQEVFVSAAGDEIPSGERFVVKSLHDVPVESYKSKEEKAQQARLNKVKIDIETLERKKTAVSAEVELQTKLLQKSKYMVQAFGEEVAERVSNFMTGKIKYLVTLDYRIQAPVSMESEILEKSDYGRFEGTKLVSIHGTKDNLQYNINRWSDGSGSNREVYPCLTYEEAILKIKEYAEREIQNDYLSKESYDKCIDLGIEFSSDAKEKYKKHRESQIKKSLEREEENLNRAANNVNDLNQELNGLVTK